MKVITPMRVLQASCMALLMISSVPLLAKSDQPISDAVITAKAKAKLGSEYVDLRVTTKNGIVKLVGNTNATADAEIIVEKVESIDGVRDVNTDNLSINGSNHLVSDMLITAKIKGEFIKGKLLEEKSVNPWITVETTNGIVYLSGQATSQEQIDCAVKIAKLVNGVKKVNITQLSINKS